MFSIQTKRLMLAKGRVGLISDTHGLMRPEALAALRGSELIVHAGDIGKPDVLSSLQAIAPVVAIRGNNDRDGWAKTFPDVLEVRLNGVGLYVIHNANELKINPADKGFHAVISGHSHKPVIASRDDIIFINPGSAGPRRFRLPVAVGRLTIREQKIKAKIVPLNIDRFD